MSDPVVRLAVAQAEADAARAQLKRTLAVLQERLQPTRLSQDARRGLVEAGHVATDRAVDAVRRRPAAIAGAAAAIVLLLARRPLARLFRRRH